MFWMHGIIKDAIELLLSLSKTITSKMMRYRFVRRYLEPLRSCLEVKDQNKILKVLV